ncbi:MAG: PilZ domain-containing protein [Pseudomonadota bacterium]
MASTLPIQSLDSNVPSLQPDRRRHRRVDVDLSGRFMREDKQEFPCKLKNISVGGASFVTPAVVRPGEGIIAYIDDIGRLEGPVFRKSPDGFVVTLRLTARARERLAAQLMWLSNRDELEQIDQRRPGHHRFAVGNRTSLLQLSDGTEHVCTVIDLSISGASLETNARPAIGSQVNLGALECLVVRHHDQGIALAFLEIQDIGDLRRLFGL